VALTQQWQAPVKPTAAKLNTASIPVVGATTDITGGLGPFAGQIIFCTADNMLYRYDGTAWVAFLATGGNTAATRHEARYEQTVAQSCANTTDLKLNFNSAVTTSNDVTASGTSNTDFAINRAGVWLITASMRWVAGTAGERHLFLSTGTVAGTLANRFAGTSSGNVATTPISQSVASVLRISTPGASVFAGCWQNNGGALNTDVAFGGSNHISLTWLRPL
jgi:hypothetical protein